MIGYARRQVKNVLLRSLHRRNETQRKNALVGHYLPPQLWGLETAANGHLQCAGVSLPELARIYGTPLYVTHKAKLRSNYDAFLNAFKQGYPHVEIAYSYKSNPLPGVLQALHEFGAAAEVISHYELWLALHLGVRPENIIFNGPAKKPEALDLAVSRGIRIINIDSEAEIDPIAALAQKHGRRQITGVRVVTSVGWASQFGIPLSDGRAYRAFERMAALKSLDPQGIHIHLGTGIRNIDTYLKAIQEVLAFALELKARLNIQLRYLDFGGGFGVPTVQGYSEWDHRLMLNGYPPGPIDITRCAPIESYGKPVVELLNRYVAQNEGFKPQVTFEPGRAVTSSAQYLLLSLVNVKTGKNNAHYAVADGGKNVTMPLGYEHHEVFPAARMNDPVSATLYNIAGPLCYPEDILFRAKRFPPLKTGDLLAIMDAGAYFVSNQQNFSNPRPAAVMVADGAHQLIRKRETFEHMIGLDV